jgi:hypothetical protein
MKSTKILNIISTLLLIVFLPLQADKKPPQIPLKDLINPNSPSYVPYPYPKTEFEIIEDFRYAVKLHFGPREGKRSSQLAGDKHDPEIILGLLGDNPGLRVREIIKVQDLVSTSPSLYYFLLRIDDNKGEVVALGRLLESGLLGGVTFFSEKAKFKPFRAENQVKEIISQSFGPIKIDKMERVGVASTISDPYTPLWKISTPAGLFFVDYFDNVYSIEREDIWTNKLPYPDPKHEKQLIIDSLNNKVIFLVKKEKK